MPFDQHKAIRRNESIQVSWLIEKLKKRLDIELKPCIENNRWKDHSITDSELYRPGLALAGFVEVFCHNRIQVLGNTECRYIDFLGKKKSEETFTHLLQFDIPVIFLTDANSLPDALIQKAKEAGVPIFKTPVETRRFIVLVRDFLEDQFALKTMIHGTMVDVYGIGILIVGKPGIGKSEVALDLIERGHRLVADDVVMLAKKNNVLMATPTEMNKHFMEIRGLGVIDIMSMFGIRAIRYKKRLEVVLELNLWKESQDIERTGLNHVFSSILGLNIPRIQLPISPGKSITVIAEVIAMNYLLREYGYDPPEVFQGKIKKHMAEKEGKEIFPRSAVDYFKGDTE
jgi:HPr kinase/phosphorylase